MYVYEYVPVCDYYVYEYVSVCDYYVYEYVSVCDYMNMSMCMYVIIHICV